MQLDLVLQALEEGLYLFTLCVVSACLVSQLGIGAFFGGIDFHRIRTLNSKGWPFGSR